MNQYFYSNKLLLIPFKNISFKFVWGICWMCAHHLYTALSWICDELQHQESLSLPQSMLAIIGPKGGSTQFSVFFPLIVILSHLGAVWHMDLLDFFSALSTFIVLSWQQMDFSYMTTFYIIFYN